jgi:hypothetical protein
VALGFRGCGKTHRHCHSEEPAGDEESRIAVKTLRARSFAAAQDDSIGAFFRSLQAASSPSAYMTEPLRLARFLRDKVAGRTGLKQGVQFLRQRPPCALNGHNGIFQKVSNFEPKLRISLAHVILIM